MLGLYSFHPGSVHVSFADGSVQFLRDTIAKILLALITRNGGEVLDADAIQ
jgi:prepilin-type processing-associated H-X9-DG protein